MVDSPTDELRRAVLCALPLLALEQSAKAQDAAKVQPQSYRVAFQNDKLRVLDYNSRPGMGVCGNGMHSHPAHLTVVVSGGSARIRTPDGRVLEQRDIPAGQVFWSDAVTHDVENIGGNHLRSLIIELVSQRA
jgi:hypothetical protein